MLNRFIKGFMEGLQFCLACIVVITIVFIFVFGIAMLFSLLKGFGPVIKEVLIAVIVISIFSIILGIIEAFIK